MTYRPEGPGHRARSARVDLSRIPDPEAWLTNRLGPLAHCDIAVSHTGQANQHARLDSLASRLTISMQSAFTMRRAALDALAARLEAVAPGRCKVSSPTSSLQKKENRS